MNWGEKVCRPFALYHFGHGTRIFFYEKRNANTFLLFVSGAGDEAELSYLHLGKVGALPDESYTCIMVPPVGVEPTTLDFQSAVSLY